MKIKTFSLILTSLLFATACAHKSCHHEDHAVCECAQKEACTSCGHGHKAHKGEESKGDHDCKVCKESEKKSAKK